MIPRFDGAAAWAALSADAQAHIGTLAIELIVANETACAVADFPGNTHPDPVRFRAACAAGEMLVDALAEAVCAALPELDNPIPAALKDLCTDCGGSAEDPCDCAVPAEQVPS